MTASSARFNEAELARLAQKVSSMPGNSRMALRRWLDAADDGLPGVIWLTLPGPGKHAPECFYYGAPGVDHVVLD